MKGTKANKTNNLLPHPDTNQLLSLLEEVVLKIDADHVITFIDPKVSRVNGYEPEEMVGRKIFDFVAEWSRAPLKDALSSTSRDKTCLNKFITTNLMKNGACFPASSTFMPLFEPDDQPAGHLIVGRDIAGDLELQSQILQNHLMYQTIVETQTELICRHLSFGTITFVNNAFSSYFDREPAQCIGSAFYDFIPKEAQETVRSRLLALTPSNPYLSIEHQALDKKGDFRWQHWIHRALFRQDGCFIEFQSSGRDITDQKMAEERVLMFKTMADVANYGIVIADIKGELVYVNPHFAAMHGIKEKRENYNIGDLHSPEQISHIRAIIDKLLCEESFNALEIRHKSADGVILPILMNGVLIRDKVGKPAYVAVTAIDISEKKRVEELIRQNNTELEAKNTQLLEMNSTLKVLLEQRERDKEDLEASILANLRDLVLPGLQTLHKFDLPEEHIASLNLLESNLLKLLSPYLREIKNRFPTLTSKELQVVSLIKDGLGTKEIAALMGISMAAINLHRHNIRQKLGLNKAKLGLSEFILSQDVRFT